MTSAGSPPTVSPARSSWTVRGVALVLATSVAVGGTVMLARYRARERAAERARDRVVETTSLAYDLEAVHGHLALATARGTGTEPIFAREAKLRADLADAAATLYSTTTAADRQRQQAVTTAVARVTDSAALAVSDVRQGQLPEGVNVALGQLIPAEERLLTLLNTELDRLEQKEEVASHNSTVGSIATLAAMFFLLIAVGTVAWWTDRRRTRVQREALRARERWYRSLIEQSGDLILVLDAGAVIRYVGPGGAEVLGLKYDDVVDRPVNHFLRDGDASNIVPLWADLCERPGGVARLDLTLCHVDGHFVHVEAICRNLLADPDVGGVVVTARDVTGRKRLEHQLVRRAFRDELTGLPNRAEFLDRLEHALTSAARTHERVAVLFIDLNGFKTINDTLGHAAGDALLVTVAKRLRGALRPSDTAARLAGDEFTVIVEEVDDEVDALDVAHRVMHEVAVPVVISGHEIKVGASVGIAFGDSTMTAADIVRNADTAMYEAKTSGRTIVLFEPEMAARAWSRLRGEVA